MSLLPRPPADASLVVDLARIVGAHGVSTSDADRFAYARDCWPRDLIRMRAGEVPTAPACVVWPETAEEVARVLQLAAELGLPIVPYGAGSGVAGGIRNQEGGITLDLKRMRAIRKLDEKNLRAEIEVGIIGERLEHILNARGYTLGHFPSSIICSTLGGWLAARSAGQTSTSYGKIEDMCFGLEVVTPSRIRRLMLGPRPGRGPDFNALVIGSEGTFAPITAAELRIRPFPESRVLRGYQFPSVEAGLTAIRKMLRAGFKPAVVRLYDALDTFIGRGHGDEDEDAEAQSFDVLAERARGLYEDLSRVVPGGDIPRRWGGKLAKSIVRGTVRAVLGSPLLLNRAVDALPTDCLLIVGFEGQPALVAAESKACFHICDNEGGKDLGPGPGEHWLKNRHNVSFKQSKAYATGVFTDTMEVASTWDRLLPMYRAVRKAIAKDAFVMAHFSHSYMEGSSIYFTFAGAAPEPDHPGPILERYDRIWKRALAAVHATGGTISHHHGVGVLKAHAMATEHGPGGKRMLDALKYALDPSGIMNPHKLGLEPSKRPKAVQFPEDRPRTFPAEIVAAVGEGNLVVAGQRTTLRPPDESSLAAVLRVANARGLAVATDQSGVRTPVGAVHVDLSRFEGVTRLSNLSLFVEAEAGVRVERLENLLNRHDLTLGHVHPRALNRSIGAAVARNLLVRRGSALGDLRDLCFAARGLLANGEPIDTRPVPRSATGPELDRALIGGWGRWGIITKVTLRIGRVWPCSLEVGYGFDNLENAIECARLVHRKGIKPAATRVVTAERGAVAAFELVSATEPVLAAQRAIARSAAQGQGGAEVDIEPSIATAGRFDAVVEVAALWSRAAETLQAVQSGGAQEAWIDFCAPEEVTVVARVADREARWAVAGAAQRCGARVLAGSRFEDFTSTVEEVPLNPRKGPPETFEYDTTGPYGDVEQRIAQAIDPAAVFRGRKR